MPLNDLHIVSTGLQNKEELIEKLIAVSAHVDFVHLRERSWSAREHIEVIDQLVQEGLPREKIIINDRIDLAVTECLGGVQLTSHSIPIQKVKKHFPHLKIGCSVHSVDEAISQEKLGADYLIYGHIFETNSKAGTPPRGLLAFQHLASSVNIPVIAIGGIKPSNIQSVMEMGASGIAVLSGILLENDSLNAALKYREKLKAKERCIKNEFAD